MYLVVVQLVSCRRHGLVSRAVVIYISGSCNGQTSPDAKLRSGLPTVRRRSHTPRAEQARAGPACKNK